LNALTIFQQLGDRRSEGSVLGSIGLIYHKTGFSNEAIHLFEKRYLIAEETNDIRGQGNALWNIAIINHDSGDKIKAIEYGKKALEILTGINDRNVSMIEGRLAEWII